MSDPAQKLQEYYRRQKEEAEAKRRAEEEAEAKRRAEEAAKRKAEEEAKRQAEKRRAKEETQQKQMSADEIISILNQNIKHPSGRIQFGGKTYNLNDPQRYREFVKAAEKYKADVETERGQIIPRQTVSHGGETLYTIEPGEEPRTYIQTFGSPQAGQEEPQIIPRQTVRQDGRVLYTIEPGEEPGAYTQTLYETPKAPEFTALQGPPQTATPSMIKRLRSEGYDLPEGKTIYVSASGQVYYYEEEISEPRKALSMELWEESVKIAEDDIGRAAGFIPYSKKGVHQIGAVIVGSVEQALTPILGLLPGEQPFELTEGEVGFSWRDVGGMDQLNEAEKTVARRAGIFAEAGVDIISMEAAYWAGTTVIGASGAAVSRIPTLGPMLEKGGVWLSNKLNTPIGKAVLAAPIVYVEGKKVIELKEQGRVPWEIAAEMGIDAAKLYGAAMGISRGLSYGKQLPAKVERLLRGGTTIPEAAFVPEYEGFPRFSEEPYPPTAKGYKEMAEAYTPEELRIADEAIPSYHATPGSLEGKTPEGFITQAGKRPGEGGMFFAPAGSKHFLRLESGYSLEPGLPNIFSEPKWIYGEFPGVVETGLGKSSPELAKILEESAGSGKLFMPAEQLGEAQAILGPTEMATVKEGRFWADMGGKTVKIERVIPKTLAEALKLKTVKIESLESLLSKQAASESYLYGPQKTTYLPILSSSTLLKKADSSLTRIGVTRTTPTKTSKVSTIESSLKKADSSLKVSSKTTSYTLEPSSLITSLISTRKTTSYLEPSYPEPSYPSPSYPEPSYPSPSYPEPSYPSPSYPGPPYTPPSYLPLIRGESLIVTTGKGKKKKKRVYELRVAFREPRLLDISKMETQLFKGAKIPGFETGTKKKGKKKGKKKKGLKIF